MKSLRFIFSTLAALSALALVGVGCGNAGGVEAGNPSQLVIGSLDGPDCGADWAIATDPSGKNFAASVAEDCSFELELPVPAAYRLDFLQASDTVAAMEFTNSSKRFPSPVMELSDAGTTTFLDSVTLKDGQAKPSRQPAAQNDRNGDGLPDASDDDDDGDGLADENETDCDLDGVVDDFDSTDCPTGGNAALEVSPRNGEGLEAHGLQVRLNEDVKVRFSCPLDAASVVPSVFAIFPSDNPSETTACVFSLIGLNNQLRCAHDDFSPDTIYTARLEGLRCEDGAAVPAVTWSWKTRL